MKSHESNSLLSCFAAAAIVNAPDSGIKRHACGIIQFDKGTRMLLLPVLQPEFYSVHQAARLQVSITMILTCSIRAMPRCSCVDWRLLDV